MSTRAGKALVTRPSRPGGATQRLGTQSPKHPRFGSRQGQSGPALALAPEVDEARRAGGQDGPVFDAAPVEQRKAVHDRVPPRRAPEEA